MATITYLEMASRQKWIRRQGGACLDVRECTVKQPCLNRFLYEYVGGDWRWTDRLAWSPQQWRDFAAADNLRTFVACTGGSIAGYYELRREGDEVQIASFGLTPEFIGHGYGGPLLDSAVQNAFVWAASRVWLHTCTDDHPNALNNYLKSGFVVFKTEQK